MWSIQQQHVYKEQQNIPGGFGLLHPPPIKFNGEVGCLAQGHSDYQACDLNPKPKH